MLRFDLGQFATKLLVLLPDTLRALKNRIKCIRIAIALALAGLERSPHTGMFERVAHPFVGRCHDRTRLIFSISSPAPFAAPRRLRVLGGTTPEPSTGSYPLSDP